MTISKSASERSWVFYLGAAFLSTGAALLTYILFKISMGLALLLAGTVVGAAVILVLSRVSRIRRRQLKEEIIKGALIGILATGAYDLSRLLLVKGFQMRFWPFESFLHFGYAIAGQEVSRDAATIIGAIYHFVNGTFFSISYCVLLGNRNWFLGILWALGLEVLMFSIYPTWLNLNAVIKEFTVVSVTGHLAYGSVLGLLARSWIQKDIAKQP